MAALTETRPQARQDGWQWHWEFKTPKVTEPPRDPSILSGERLLNRANILEVKIKSALSESRAFTEVAPPDFFEDKEFPEGEEVLSENVVFSDTVATWKATRIQFKPKLEGKSIAHTYIIGKYEGVTKEQVRTGEMDDEPVEIGTLDLSDAQPRILFYSELTGPHPENSKTARNGLKRLLNEIRRNALLKPKEKPDPILAFNASDDFLAGKEGLYGYYVSSEVSRLATEILPPSSFEPHLVRLEGSGTFEKPMIRIQSPNALGHDWLIFPDGRIFLCEIDRQPPHILNLNTLTDKYSLSQIAKDSMTLLDALARKVGLKRHEETGRYVPNETIAQASEK